MPVLLQWTLFYVSCGRGCDVEAWTLYYNRHNSCYNFLWGGIDGEFLVCMDKGSWLNFPLRSLKSKSLEDLHKAVVKVNKIAQASRNRSKYADSMLSPHEQLQIGEHFTPYICFDFLRLRLPADFHLWAQWYCCMSVIFFRKLHQVRLPCEIHQCVSLLSFPLYLIPLPAIYLCISLCQYRNCPHYNSSPAISIWSSADAKRVLPLSSDNTGKRNR